MGGLWQVGKQEITVDQPIVDECCGICWANAGVLELLGQVRARGIKRRSVQFDGADAVSECFGRGGFRQIAPSLKKTFDGHKKKVTVAKGRFQQDHLVKRPIGRVTNKIENEFDHFRPREYRAAFLYSGLGKLLERFLDGTKAGQGSLSGQRLSNERSFGHVYAPTAAVLPGRPISNRNEPSRSCRSRNSRMRRRMSHDTVTSLSFATCATAA